MLLSVSGRRVPRVLVVLLAALVVAAGLAVVVAVRASGSVDHCPAYTAAHRERLGADVGEGSRVAVIGDSYSVGLGLDRPADSWPSRLPGRVHVDGFSGSGFSAGASPCGRVSYADRAAEALSGDPDLVVVEGGLNDVDQPAAAIRRGFRKLAAAIEGHRVLVVGPVMAPARAAWVPAVDTLLTRLCRRAGLPYLSTTDLDLDYLGDGLHLTAASHALLGDDVAAHLH